MLDDHAHVMQVKLCKANTRGVTSVLLGHPQLVDIVSYVIQSRLVCWHSNGNFSCNPLNIALENPKHV